MASLSNFLYPPIVEPVMDSFIRTNSCRIYFGINDFNNIEDIAGIQVIAYQQDNNQYALDKKYTGQSNIINMQFDSNNYSEDKQLYFITLSPQLFSSCEYNSSKSKSGFPVNMYFRIQLRFIKSGFDWNIATNSLDNYYYLTPQQLYENQQYWSEWSTACLIRGINKPNIRVENDNRMNVNTLSYKTNLVDLYAKVQWYDTLNNKLIQDNSQFESLQSYQIKIFLEQEGYEVLLADSGLLYPSIVDESKNQLYYKIPYKFEVGSQYKIYISYVTTGNYQVNNQLLDYFQIIESTVDSELEYDVFRAVCNNEEGYIHLQLTGTFNGNLCIRRSDSSTNFTVWEDIKYIPLISEEEQLNFYFNDFTVKSGVFYKYGIQRITSNNIRGKLYELGEGDTYTLLPDFENIFLVSGNQQLKIKYNKQVSDFKHVIKESISETLGSKYPYVRRNSNVDYRQFHIQGLISYQADEKNLLVSKNDLHRQIGTVLTNYEVYEEYEDAFMMMASDLTDVTQVNKTTTVDSLAESRGVIEEIPYDTNSIFGVYNTQYKNSTLQQVKSKIAQSYKKYNEIHRINELYDVTLERDFREEVMKFLYSNKAMLYKSGEEGNMIVKLTEISFTPNQELQGRVYDFSATVNEIAEYNIDNCFKYDIQNIGTLSNGIVDYKLEFNSLFKKFNAGTNIVDYIKTINNTSKIDNNNTTITEIPYLNWIKMEFQDDPYWMSSDGSIVTKNPSEINESYLYGHGFKLSYMNKNNEEETVFIYVNSTNSRFELTDTQIDEDEKDIYEATIYNVYVNGKSLYENAYELCSKDTSLSREMVEDKATEMAEQTLKQLAFYENFSITGITLLIDETVNLDYFYRANIITYTNVINTQIVNVQPDQEKDVFNYGDNLTTAVNDKYVYTKYKLRNGIQTTEKTAQQEILSLSNVSFEAPENTVLLIKDEYAEGYTINDDNTYRHLIGKTGYLELADLNSIDKDITIKTVQYGGRHYYYAPMPNELLNSWYSDSSLEYDIDLNSEITLDIMKRYQTWSNHMDTSYMYDCTSLKNETQLLTLSQLILKPYFHSNCLYVVKKDSKSQPSYWMNIDGTAEGWYEAALTDSEEDITKGIDLKIPAYILFNYIAQTRLTTYVTNTDNI